MKIAHISDFHLRRHLPGTSAVSRRQSRLMPGLLAEAAARIQAEKPDLVVVTGDLVDHPFVGTDEPEILAAGEMDLRLIAGILEGFACPVAVVHGNHDHPVLFDQVFGSIPELEARGHRVLCFYDQEVDGHFPQRLGRERERFLAALQDRDPRPQIHVQHYLIAPERNQGYPHTYREGESIKQSLLADGRVRLVLSGHYHRGEPLFRQGEVYFGIAPAFAEPPHPYRIYALTDDGVSQKERSLRPVGEGGAPRRAVFLDRDGAGPDARDARWF